MRTVIIYSCWYVVLLVRIWWVLWSFCITIALPQDSSHEKHVHLTKSFCIAFAMPGCRFCCRPYGGFTSLPINPCKRIWHCIKLRVEDGKHVRRREMTLRKLGGGERSFVSMKTTPCRSRFPACQDCTALPFRRLQCRPGPGRRWPALLPAMQCIAELLIMANCIEAYKRVTANFTRTETETSFRSEDPTLL